MAGVTSNYIIIITLLLTPTIVVGIKHLAASVCVCVCLHNKTKMAETTATKLDVGIVHHESSPTN